MTPNPNDFPEAIFTNATAFGLMDPEHQDALRRWVLMGGDVQWYGHNDNWWERSAPSARLASFARGSVYRAVRPALIKPSVDWSHLLPWVKWVAWEWNDRPFAFAGKPIAMSDHWSGEGYHLRATPGLIRGTVPWTEAIVQRPEGV